MAPVLIALIRMHHHLARRFASPDGHEQRVDRQLPGHAFPHRPAHHLAREQIEHDGQIQPPLVGADLGNVGRPDLVRLSRFELAIQVVGHHHRGAPTVLARAALVARVRALPGQTHWAPHPMLAETFAHISQVVAPLR
jgi:hypothetical protein